MQSSKSFLTAINLARSFTTASKSGISTMKPGSIPKAFGPYSFGKLVTTPNGTWGYSAG